MSDSMKKMAPLTSQFVQHNKGGYNLRNRKKIKTNNNHDNDNVVDRLSALPDEVVVTIVSLLPLKEAAATSILSRRWRFLWASTMTLHFDDEKALRNLSTLFRKPEIQELEKCRYIDWVNSVVEKHKGPRVEQFRIAFDLDHNFSTSIDKWIQFAMKKGVQVLELDLLEYGNCFRKHGYTLTKEVLGIKAVKPLCYGIPSLHPSVCIGFKSLKVLHFKSVCVDGEVLEYLSSNCPALEQLSVLNSSNLRNLRVVGPSIALKCLVIEECDNIKSIEICDANLVLFVYSGLKINLLLRNVPLLVEVAVCMSDHSFRFGLLEVFFTQLSCCLSQLETLKLTRSVLRYKENHIFPRLANLKNLELTFVSEYDCSLLLLNSFMKASPLLRRLVLYFCYSSRLERRGTQYKKAAKFSHYYLKVVELIGYGRGITDFELVKYFVENAVRLEKVIVDYDHIHPGKLYWCFPRHRIPESYKQEKRRLQDGEKVERVGLANHVGQRLRETVPSTIQLVCL